MKPYIICHMTTSVDGRILTGHWQPPMPDSDVYERIHNGLGCDAWPVGRITGQEFAQREDPYPQVDDVQMPRQNWYAVEAPDAWAVVLDAQGKIAWGRGDIGGDPIFLVVLSRSASDSHLAGLRDDGVSYIFGGETEIDLAETLETLNRELGVQRILLEGGGGVNGTFLQAGLIDELSLLIAPSIDGTQGNAALFDIAGGNDALRDLKMSLLESRVLEDGIVWLQYSLR